MQPRQAAQCRGDRRDGMWSLICLQSRGGIFTCSGRSVEAYRTSGSPLKTRAVLQLRAAPCFEDQLHPACNRSTVSTGRGASHSTTCIPGGSTRGHRGDVLQTSRQWLRQDATEFRTQTNVHGAQDQRGLPLISALRSGSTGDPQTSFGSHKFACQRELAPRLYCRSIYPETDQRTGESATPT